MITNDTKRDRVENHGADTQGSLSAKLLFDAVTFYAGGATMIIIVGDHYNNTMDYKTITIQAQQVQVKE